MNLGQLRNVISAFVQRHDTAVDLPVELFNELINVASIQHFKRRLGLPERYQPGQPFPGEIAEITMKSAMDLRPFLVHRDINDSPLSFTSGTVAYPKEFCYPLSASHLYVHTDGEQYERRFDFVTEMQWSEQMGTVNKAPTPFFPIMRFTRVNINIAPKTIRLVNFVYYKWPRRGRIVTSVINGVNIYDPELSVELEWNEANMIDIAHLLLANIGVAVNKEAIFAVADKVKQQGI